VSPISLVIFDLDGTLLDTIEDITEATNRVLGARGLAPFTAEETKHLVGDGIDSLPDADVEAIIQDYRREYQACWRDNSHPFDGIPELLAELARRGTKTAVLSNKSDIYTARMTDALLAGHRFEIVRGARLGVPLKPDPSSALAIAAELGVEPSACAFVGDTNVDMATARAAGMLAVGALWGFRTAEELLRNGADVLIASPRDLLRHLG
jgi:phosphoglycolate phosphatase